MVLLLISDLWVVVMILWMRDFLVCPVKQCGCGKSVRKSISYESLAAF